MGSICSYLTEDRTLGPPSMRRVAILAVPLLATVVAEPWNALYACSFAVSWLVVGVRMFINFDEAASVPRTGGNSAQKLTTAVVVMGLACIGRFAAAVLWWLVVRTMALITIPIYFNYVPKDAMVVSSQPKFGNLSLVAPTLLLLSIAPFAAIYTIVVIIQLSVLASTAFISCGNLPTVTRTTIFVA